MVLLALLVAGDQRVVAQARLQLVHHHEGVDTTLAAIADQGVGDLSWM